MANIKAFRAILSGRNDDRYRITIWDLAGSDTPSANTALYGYAASESTSPVNIKVIHESVEITYDADVDSIHTPVVGSNCSMTFLLENDTYYLIDILAARSEGEVAVRIDRHNGTTTNLGAEANWDRFWIGCMTHEGITYDLSNCPIMLEMVFSDGISLLGDVPYANDDSTPYVSGTNFFQNIRYQIGLCLTHMPHKALWDQSINAPFFVEQLDMYHWNHVDTTDNRPHSILEESGCNMMTWYDRREHDNPFNRKHKVIATGSTCYEVLSDIMTAVGATFFHTTTGGFAAVSPFLSEAAGANNYLRAWSSDYRSMTDAAYNSSAAQAMTSTDYPDKVDYTNCTILQGSTVSFQNPIKGIMYTHEKGGSPVALLETLPVTAHGDPFNDDNLYLPDGTLITNSSGPSFPRENSSFKIVGGKPLVIKGRCHLDMGDALSPLQSGDEDFIGAQPVLRFTIKVGNQYLKQTVGVELPENIDDVEKFGRIHIAIGNLFHPGGFDITTWRPLVITDDVEWTTDVSYFEIPYSVIGQMEPDVDVIEHSDGEEVRQYPVGLHCVRHESFSSRQRFQYTDRNTERDLILDITTPELPGDEDDTYEGIEVDLEVNRIYKADMTTSTFAASPYADGGGLGIHNFRVFAGDGDEKDDVLYYATVTDDGNNRVGFEMVDGGETTLASRQSNYWGDIGILKSNDDGHRGDGNSTDGYEPYWFSEANDGNNPTAASDGTTSMSVLVKEHLSLRKSQNKFYNLALLLNDRHMTMVQPHRRITIDTGTFDAVVQVLRSTLNLMSGVLTVDGFEVQRISSGLTVGSSITNNISRDRNGQRIPAGFTKPVGSISGSTSVNNTRLEALPRSQDDIIATNFFLEK